MGNVIDMIHYSPMFTNYTIRSDNSNFDSIDGVIYTEDHKQLVICPMNKNKVRILDGTTTICFAGFRYNIATSIGPVGSGADIEAPNTLTACQDITFSGMPNLIWAELWDGCQYNNSHFFTDCAKLKSLYIPSSVTTLGRPYDGANWVGTVGQSRNVTIYCERTSKPSGWDQYWNASDYAKPPSSYAPVVWGVSRETYRANNRYLNN